MHTRWGFYFRNSISSLKKSVWVILGLSIAISMIAGVSYYYDAFENDFVDLDYWHMDDVSFQFTTPIDPVDAINFSESFNQDFEGTSDAINESELAVESFHKYGYITGEDERFTVRFNENVHTSLCLFDTDVYSSNRFQNNIVLIEGNYPNASNAIMIDYVTAQKANFSINSYINLTFRIDLGFENIEYFVVYDLYLSGTYALSEVNDDYIFTFDEVEHLFEYNSFNLPSSSFDGIDDVGLIFAYSNFTNDIHPFQNLYDKMYSDLIPSYDYLAINVGSGVTIFLDRTDLQLNKASSIAQDVEAECIRIRIRSDADLEINNYFSERILSLDDDYNFVRYFLLLLNLPIFLAAIIFASFGIKMTLDHREEQYLLMRSRGMPKSMIARAFTFEMIMIGACAIVMGIFGGIGTFYGFTIWFKNLRIDFASLDPFTNQNLPFTWSLKSHGITLGISVVTILISSISGYKKLKRISVSDVLSEYGDHQSEINLNEEHIFGLDGLSTALVRNKSLRKKKNPKSKNRDLTRKWSVLFILIGAIPILFYLFILISGFFDSLYFWATIVSNSIDRLFPIIFPVCGICLCIGVIRLMTIERRKWFAKVISKISSLFLKKKSYLVGVNLSQKKNIFRLMFLLCGFCGILIQSNVYINSEYHYNNIEYNLHVGTDFNGYFKTEGNLKNISMLQEIEDAFYSLNTSTGEIIVDSSEFIYRDKMYPSIATIDYVNFTRYMEMMTQTDNFIPQTKLFSSIENLLGLLNGSTYALGFADDDFLYFHDLQVGDLYTFTHEYHNYSKTDPGEHELSTQITCKIVDQIDLIPGIDPSIGDFESYRMEQTGHLTIDSSCLDMHPSLLHASELIHILNFNQSLQIPQIELESRFKDVINEYSHYQAFAFFEDFSDVRYSAFTDGSGYYGIVYMDLVIVGVFFSFGIAVFLTSMIQQDMNTYGILLSRGFGRKNIVKYALSQWFVIIIIPLFISIIVGGLSAILFAKLQQFMILRSFSLFSVPIYVNIPELILVFSSIVIFSFLISVLPFILGFKKEINHYLYKF